MINLKKQVKSINPSKAVYCEVFLSWIITLAEVLCFKFLFDFIDYQNSIIWWAWDIKFSFSYQHCWRSTEVWKSCPYKHLEIILLVFAFGKLHHCPSKFLIVHCCCDWKHRIEFSVINWFLLLSRVLTSEANWANQNLTIFSGFQIAGVKLKLVQSSLFLSFLFAIQVNPDQSVAVAFSNHQDVFVFVFAENDSVGKVKLFCNQTQLLCLFVELKDSSKRIVEPEVNLEHLQFDSVTGLSEINEVWISGIDLNFVKWDEEFAMIPLSKDIDLFFLDVELAQSHLWVGKVQ